MVPGRHKGIARLDGLRGKNFVHLDDDRYVFIEHPGATGHFMFILHLLLNNHLKDKIFLSLVQKEGNQNF